MTKRQGSLKPTEGGKAGDGNEPLDGAGREWRALEAPHVAAPFQEVVKPRAKIGIELRRPN
jgi:hypothetical protein